MTQINIGWAMAVTFGVLTAYPLSHGHINPAWSIVRSFQGALPWSMLPIYIGGQCVGAFIGAAVVHGNYHHAIAAYHGSKTWNVTTLGIYAPLARPDTAGLIDCFYNQVLGTGLLFLFAMLLLDKRMGYGMEGVPLAFALAAILAVLTAGLDFHPGSSTFNPARDFMPRLFTALVGWPCGTAFGFRALLRGWWIGIVGPTVGGLAAGTIFNLLLAPNYSHNPLDH